MNGCVKHIPLCEGGKVRDLCSEHRKCLAVEAHGAMIVWLDFVLVEGDLRGADVHNRHQVDGCAIFKAREIEHMFECEFGCINKQHMAELAESTQAPFNHLVAAHCL